MEHFHDEAELGDSPAPILVMESKHRRRIQDKFARSLVGKEVICLNIPDDYHYMDEDLIGLLLSSVSEYIDVH
ncbi:hypothetical protein DUZ99_19465 [Xylanibacillus composti]|uniref:Protein-tyrosine-phosphatase n=1 Tax=Xylanibacillus composti TaxID=1572762 RepID=A0A8J4H925_9BACL|nr:hypothetical protein [Xylanibacillus composti]MDT9727144.1 hypothetical protein [Xylanibacillus composti]GIQ71408.1 hypothetical protein XYCOK13_42320 [Xylanibacillus composti]